MSKVARLYDHGEFNVQSFDERAPTVCKYNKITVQSASFQVGQGLIYINDVLIRNVSRSWAAVRLDQYGELVDSIYKDVWGYAEQGIEFWKYLESTPAGWTLIIVTGDEPLNNSWYFVDTLERYGFIKVRNLNSHSAWAGIVRKGDRVIMEEYAPIHPALINKTIYEPKGFVKFLFDGQYKASNGYGSESPIVYRKSFTKTSTRSYDVMPITYAANTPFIFECEFKPNWDCQDDKYLIGFAENESLPYTTWNLGIYNGRLWTYPDIYDTTAVISQGVKYYLKLVYDGSILKVYLDGVLKNTRIVNIAASTQVRICEYQNLAETNSNWFIGDVWNWKLSINPIINEGTTISQRGMACEERTYNLMPNPHPDTKVFYNYDGWEVVHLLDTRVTPDFTDWLTDCFVSGENQAGVVYTLSFWGKGNMLIGWENTGITINWLESPTPSITKYQRYVAQVYANSNVSTELFRLYYYYNIHDAYLYIANPQIERKYRPSEYTPKVRNLITKPIENYGAWTSNQWWLHGASSATVEQIVNPFGATTYVLKGTTAGPGIYCYPPHSRENFITGQLYVGTFWMKNSIVGTTGYVHIRNADEGWQPPASLWITISATDNWQKYTYYWYANYPEEMHTYAITNAYIYGVEVYAVSKDNGNLQIPLELPSGDFTLFGIKTHSKFEGTERVQALVRSGNTFKFYENGVETNAYQNTYRRYDCKSLGIGRIAYSADYYYDPDNTSLIADSIYDTMNLSVDNEARYYKTWVFCSSDVTTIHRYASDNYGAIRVNSGTEQSLGDWNWQTNPDITITLKQGWNLIEYMWMDGDSGGGFYLQIGTAIHSLPEVLYMTSEMPVEFLKNNRIGYNSRSNVIAKDVTIYNYALSDKEIKEMSVGNTFKLTPEGYFKSIKVKEERSFPIDGAYYFPLAEASDSKAIAVNHVNLEYERGCVYAGQATTNLFLNPKLENIGSWGASNDGLISASDLPNEGLPSYNKYCTKVTAPTQYGNLMQYPTLVAGQIYTLSSWIYCPTGLDAAIYVWYNNPWLGIGGAFTDSYEKDKWVRKIFTFTAPSATIYNVSAGFLGVPGSIYACRAQIENKGYATHWTNSSRGASRLWFNLYYKLGLDWSGDWTIIYWKKPIGTYTGGLDGYNISSFGCGDNSVGGGYLWFGKENGSNKLRAGINFYDYGSDFNPINYFGKWEMVSLRKNGSNINVSEWGIDGIKRRYIDLTDPIPSANYFVTQYGFDFNLGGWHNPENQNDSYYKDLIIYKSALTDGQIENIYDVKTSIYKDCIKIPFFREYM